MNISINNQTKQIEENSSLQKIIDSTIGEKQKGIAVAIDGTVVPRLQWAQTFLKENQSVLIIKATQGG
jgi:sulfur carrier protein